MNKNTKSNQLTKYVVLTWIALAIIVLSSAIVEAAATIPNPDPPKQDQYFELKATTISDVTNQADGSKSKQVIMELWGYNIDFKRTSCQIQIRSK